MTNETIKITALEVIERPTEGTLEAWLQVHPAEVVVEILNRYHDSQVHARNYRQRAALKQKALTSLLQAKATEAGFQSVEEYLKAQ